MSREPDYASYTREHYRDPAVAEAYAHRLRRSPVEWGIGRLERAGVAAGLRALGATRIGLVVDVPAGTGKLTEWLSGRADAYLALDVSTAMLAELPEPSWRAQADATQLPLADNSVDCVVMLRLLHRVPDAVADRMVHDALRVARTGLVVSYAGAPALAPLHRALQRVSGRGGTLTTPRSPAEFATLAARAGGQPVFDRSISAGITAERICAIRPQPQ
ncbi:MAG TPA: class I SAM-dependent methyltransferase [Mycobacteriales bacterium]|nr:class I SAM-dependent methyltransferase [Mycobacteriales bacterium]